MLVREGHRLEPGEYGKTSAITLTAGEADNNVFQDVPDSHDAPYRTGEVVVLT